MEFLLPHVAGSIRRGAPGTGVQMRCERDARSPIRSKAGQKPTSMFGQHELPQGFICSES